MQARMRHSLRSRPSRVYCDKSNQRMDTNIDGAENGTDQELKQHAILL
jgi:hypothetical protein